MEIIINSFLTLLGIYLFLGVVFAILFLMRGVQLIDEAAQDISWRFRLIIVPGVIAFWPILLKKWRNSSS